MMKMLSIRYRASSIFKFVSETLFVESPETKHSLFKVVFMHFCFYRRRINIMKNSCSPLKPLSTVLRTFRLLCGFPLRVADPGEVTMFSFESSSLFRCLLVPFSFINASLVALILLVFTHMDASWPVHVERLKGHGLSGTELTAVILQFTPNCFGLVVFVLLFKRSAKSLSRFCMAIADFKSAPQVSGQFEAAAKSSLGWILVFYGLLSLAATASVIYYVQICGSWIPTVNLVGVIVLAFVNVIVVFFPFSVASAYVIVLQLMSCLQILLANYNGELSNFIQHQHFASTHSVFL